MAFANALCDLQKGAFSLGAQNKVKS
jgi:hypothetical protein